MFNMEISLWILIFVFIVIHEAVTETMFDIDSCCKTENSPEQAEHIKTKQCIFDFCVKEVGYNGTTT